MRIAQRSMRVPNFTKTIRDKKDGGIKVVLRP